MAAPMATRTTIARAAFRLTCLEQQVEGHAEEDPFGRLEQVGDDPRRTSPGFARTLAAVAAASPAAYILVATNP